MKQLFYKKWKLSVGINTKTDVFIYVDYLYLSDIKRKYIIADMCKTKIQFFFNLQNATVIQVRRYRLTPTAQVRVPATRQPLHR